MIWTENDDYGSEMLIVNGGLPRSGTVLVGTMICEILRIQGYLWQRYNPQERRHLPQFADRVRSWPSGQTALLVHTHVADQAVLNLLAGRRDAAVFWNHRDPRDVAVSLRKLHDMPLDRAIIAVQVYAGIEQVVMQSGLAVRLRYEDIIKDPADLVGKIAAALDADLSPGRIAEIVEKTSIDRHRKIMRKLADGGDGARTLTTINRPLREDPDTLINDRHIQSGTSGRWRQELSPEEQQMVDDALRPFAKALGYQT